MEANTPLDNFILRSYSRLLPFCRGSKIEQPEASPAAAQYSIVSSIIRIPHFSPFCNRIKRYPQKFPDAHVGITIGQITVASVGADEKSAPGGGTPPESLRDTGVVSALFGSPVKGSCRHSRLRGCFLPFCCSGIWIVFLTIPPSPLATSPLYTRGLRECGYANFAPGVAYQLPIRELIKSLHTLFGSALLFYLFLFPNYPAASANPAHTE